MIIYSIINKLDNKQFLFFNSSDCIYFLKTKYNIKTELGDLIDVKNIIAEEINITGRQIIYGVYSYNSNSYHSYFNTEQKAIDELNNKKSLNNDGIIDNYKLILNDEIIYIIHPIIVQ